jgi:RNA polymerase sigma-70 factor (ECF subfamily)
MRAVARLRSGGGKAAGTVKPSFAVAAEQHLDDVYRYLLYLTKDAALAEDLTSETFERAFRAWDRFDGRASPSTWLCKIGRNVALDHFRSEERRRRREERYASEQAEVYERTRHEFSPEVERALAGLSAAEREVIALRVILELDGESTARVLGISRTACSMRLSRALETLKDKVGADVVA